MGKPERLSSETLKPAIPRAELVKRLSTVLPATSLLHQAEELRPFECDGLSAYREVPLAVALPENEKQLAAMIRKGVCHGRHRTRER